MRLKRIGKCILQGIFVCGMVSLISAPAFARGGSLSGSKAVSAGNGKYYAKTEYNNNISPGTKVYAYAWIQRSLLSDTQYGQEVKLGINGSASVRSSAPKPSGYYRCHMGGLRSNTELYEPDAYMSMEL